MSLVALDGMPVVMVGAASRQGIPNPASLGGATVDATNEAVIMYGHIFTEDGGSHTIDTTGSSALGWRTGSVTFSNGGTTVKVGLAAVLTTAGPPTRAANASDVITFDVSKSLTGGGGGITTTAWQSHVPDAGSKTIANGDLVAFCVQMTARGGADSVVVQGLTQSPTGGYPATTNYTGGSYADGTRLPNVVITFSDGTLGFFFGGYVATTGATNVAWNSGSATKEYGNYFLLPVPVKVYGLVVQLSLNASADCDVILYSDPLGTPVAEKTISLDANAVSANGSLVVHTLLFPAPYSLTASTPVAAIVKPTTANNVTFAHKTFDASAHQKSDTLGTNAYAVNRASGAFAAQNSNKDRFAIGLLVGAFANDLGNGQASFNMGLV